MRFFGTLPNQAFGGMILNRCSWLVVHISKNVQVPE